MSNQTISTPPDIRRIHLPGHRLRRVASALYSLHNQIAEPLPSDPITVVCISDTHGTQPCVPDGDLLLHAGDLSVWGTFDEIQAQLTWLDSLPHRFKVVIAGNHDLLLDADFEKQYPETWRRILTTAASGPESDARTPKTAQDLDWGSLVYLQDRSTSLSFSGGRTLKIYGSPRTPRFGISAFQYPLSEGEAVWSNKVPHDVDILLTHGPPRGRLDGFKHSGCPYLAREVMRVKPHLVVFGHIHVGYGTEERILDSATEIYEDIMMNGKFGFWRWLTIFQMAFSMLTAYLHRRIGRRRVKVTTFVNAAVVQGWENHVVKNDAIVRRI